MARLFDDDLKLIHRGLDAGFLDQKRIFMTGMTGFFGQWILESLAWLVQSQDIHPCVVVLSRDPERFLCGHPSFRNLSWLTFMPGDVRTCTFPEGHFDYIIHGAADARDEKNPDKQTEISDVIECGMSRILNFGLEKDLTKLLYISSGAAYGTQPRDLEFIPEGFSCCPETSYGKAKFDAENKCRFYIEQHQMNIVIARCFTFIGPYLPLDCHYAVGNFLKAVLNGQDIVIKGSGQAIRSYLYMADLMIWLLRILDSGRSGMVYNIGSDRRISIEDLARLIIKISGGRSGIAVTNEYHEEGVSQYVPCIDRASQDLGLGVSIDLEDAVRRTLDWFQ